MIRVVLDTNVLISSISRKSPYHVILQQLMVGTYSLYITGEMLLEYEEKIAQFYGKAVAETLLNALIVRPNVVKIETYFDLGLIHTDPDDNKFVNCAFAANANFLVTNDKHFNILKKVDFPKFRVISTQAFAQWLE